MRLSRKNPRLYYWIQIGYKGGEDVAWSNYFDR
jgi:hypothetical protein